MPKSMAVVLLAIILGPFRIGCYAENHPQIVPPCRPSSLDVYALPPATSSPVPKNHLLVFEVQNIGKTLCSLDSPVVQLTPLLHNAYDESDSIHYLPNGSSTSGRFDETVFSPGDWVHTLIVWNSQGYNHAPCEEHSALKLLLMHESRGMTPVTKTSVEVRNLQIRSCPLVYVSEYRKGRYTPTSPIPDDWLRNPYSAEELYPVPAKPTDLQVLRDPSLFQLDNSSNRVMVGEDFGLRLRRTAKAESNCDYRLLRRRDSDGTTTISLQNCDELENKPNQAQTPSSEFKQTYLDPVFIAMQPKIPGPLAYDAISNIGSFNAPQWTEAHIDLLAHDPTPPAQAPILGPLPDCTESQLKLDFPPPVIAIPGTTLQAYEATNTSATPCTVAGVPSIHVEEYVKVPCPNCENDLFVPRPNGRIDLEPGRSAHFLVGREYHSETGFYASECQIRKVSFGLSEKNRPLTLPFAGGACGTLDVSAWREGRFDHDPKNLQWAKTHPASSDPTTAIPGDCDKPELLSMGRPLMMQRGKDLALGLSMVQHEFKAGENITLHVWVDNTSNTPAGVMTCMGLDYFKATGFDLYDAYGHRVLRRNEAKRQEQCKTHPDLASREFGWSCTRNFPITIPAHTCITNDEYDFTTGLTAGYDLPPGEYTVRPRASDSEDLCNPKQVQPIHAVPGKDLMFSVVQP